MTRTELQRETSRINGAKSSGPASEEGRSRAAQNSRKHGIFARDLILPGESQEQFDALFESFRRKYRAETDDEVDIIREMTVVRWRLRRVWKMETSVCSNEPGSMEDIERQLKSLNTVSRYEARLQKSYEEALARLQELRAMTLGDDEEDEDDEDDLDEELENMQNEPEGAFNDCEIVEVDLTPGSLSHLRNDPEALKDLIKGMINAPVPGLLTTRSPCRVER